MTDYIDKSGEAALRGIRLTGDLDDDGLPELAWYTFPVETLTAASVIEAMLDAIGFEDLSREEQNAIGRLVIDSFRRDFQRRAVRRIVNRHRREKVNPGP